jgi:aspartate aminotransferase
MAGGISIEPHVDALVMPENLRVGLMVAEQRKKCESNGCRFSYYGFGFGQSPFHVPQPIARSLGENAARGYYSDAEGIPELRAAIAGFNERHFGLDVDPSRVIVGPGTKHLIHIIFDVLVGGVIIPSPSWIGYSPQIRLLDKHFHTFRLKPEHDYKIRPADLDEFVSTLEGEQHMLVLNNPHNPTGVVYSADELEAIAYVCRKHNVVVIADEIYALTTYDFGGFASMGLIYPEGTFVTNGLSKDRSAGGYRLGACILPVNCPGKLADDFKKVIATMYTNVSTPTQYAAVTAYEPNDEIEEYFRVTREVHRMMGWYVSEGFGRIDGIKVTKPQGGFYFFVDFNELAGNLRRKGVETSNGLAPAMLKHPFHVAVVTGDACLLEPDDFGARVAFVDYDGKAAYDDYRTDRPTNEADERDFVERNAPRMVRGVGAVREYVEYVKS